jgi:ATP/maltotriose-dependent transcriptional regulator MalT
MHVPPPLQLLRVSQMLLQYMRYKLEQGQAASSAAEEQQAELALQLAALPDLGLAELGSGLGQLQQGFDALAQLEALLGAGAGAAAGSR